MCELGRHFIGHEALSAMSRHKHTHTVYCAVACERVVRMMKMMTMVSLVIIIYGRDEMIIKVSVCVCVCVCVWLCEIT